MTLEALAAAAARGDRRAAEGVLAAVEDDVYGLALRMLWDPADAEDAAQEILLKVLTHLGTFRGESALRTWVFRIACNHLLNVRRGRRERQGLSFEEMGADLARGLAEPAAPDQATIVEEIKVGCTLAMLQCLDRAQRLAYILGAVFELPAEDAATLVGVGPAAFRKRLSRARARIREFMEAHCGLVNAACACRCEKRVEAAIAAGRVEPGRPRFPRAEARSPSLLRSIREMEALHDEAAAIHRSLGERPAPEALRERVRVVLRTRGSLV